MKQVDFRSEDRLRFPPPSLAWVLVRTDQLLLLGIDANHRQAGTYVKPPQAGQRAELRSRSGSLTSASCLRLVRSEKPASCNTRAMVFADTLIPWRRRALASFRVERCVHSKPVVTTPPREQGGFLGQPPLRLGTGFPAARPTGPVRAGRFREREQ
ncbi:MAG: hypothetical protein WA746_01235, partial [Isosphaeraceae bacterium]